MAITPWSWPVRPVDLDHGQPERLAPQTLWLKNFFERQMLWQRGDVSALENRVTVLSYLVYACLFLVTGNFFMLAYLIARGL